MIQTCYCITSSRNQFCITRNFSFKFQNFIQTIFLLLTNFISIHIPAFRNFTTFATNIFLQNRNRLHLQPNDTFKYQQFHFWRVLFSKTLRTFQPTPNPPLSELAIHRTEKVFNFQRWRVYFSQLHLTTTRYQLPQLLPDCLLCVASEKTFCAIFEFISLSPRTFCHPLRLTNIIYGLMCRFCAALIFLGESFTIPGRADTTERDFVVSRTIVDTTCIQMFSLWSEWMKLDFYARERLPRYQNVKF